jgi:hypothetical protein
MTALQEMNHLVVNRHKSEHEKVASNLWHVNGHESVCIHVYQRNWENVLYQNTIVDNWNRMPEQDDVPLFILKPIVQLNGWMGGQCIFCYIDYCFINKIIPNCFLKNAPPPHIEYSTSSHTMWPVLAAVKRSQWSS